MSLRNDWKQKWWAIDRGSEGHQESDEDQERVLGAEKKSLHRIDPRP
jgi:hypothetical protein